MAENDDPNEPVDEPDGVRLVGREEAEAAIEAGRAIGRRQLFATPPTSGPEATSGVARFPSNTDESQSSPRPAVIVRKTPVIIGDEDESVLDLRFPDADADDAPEIIQSMDSSDDELPESTTGSTPALPHWTDPPTGEVPVTPADASGASNAPGDFSDLLKASGLGTPVDPDDLHDLPEFVTPKNQRQDEPPADGDGELVEQLGEFGDDAAPALDDTDVAGEAEDEAAPAFTPKSVGDQPNRWWAPGGTRGTRFRGPGDEKAPIEDKPKVEIAALKSSSLGPRVTTGVAFAVCAIVAFSAGPAWTLTLATAVILLASVELFDGLRRVGYKPATLLALVAVAGCMLGSYARGAEAMPLVLALVVLFTFLWYLTGVINVSPTSNVAVTVLGFVWTGALGSYAALLLRLPNRTGMALLAGAVLLTIVYDTAAYVGGSIAGRHPLAPAISPGKTWEGLAAGTIGAVVVGTLLLPLIHPWGFKSGILLGLVVSAVAPLGDLAESMVKRDLGLKDMGRVLPGHGGVMDRFDALLFVLPATYYLARMLNLA